MEREAFGAPIASFQVLQHRAADMLLRTESTRSAVYRAGWALETGQPNADYLTSVAKARELGIPDSKWVYLHGCADAYDHWYISDRKNFHSSPAMKLALGGGHSG